MAKLVVTGLFTAAGTLIGGPIGGAIGGILGGLAANRLFPTDGPTIRVGTPQITDNGETGASYGAPIPYIRGTDRLRGTCVWQGPRRVDIIETEQSIGGGKGGGSDGTQITTTVKVFRSWRIVFCEGPGADVLKIFFRGKPVFDQSSGTGADAPGADSLNAIP